MTITVRNGGAASRSGSVFTVPMHPSLSAGEPCVLHVKTLHNTSGSKTITVPSAVTAMATAGASSLLTTFLEDSPNHDQIPQELEMHTITAWLRSLL